jgi:hypothetical protein
MLIEDRRVSPSKDEAIKAAIAEKISSEKCKQCNASIDKGKVLGAEEIPPAKYTVKGYTCECGERVEVYRFEDGISYHPPATFTSVCSKGHSRTMTSLEAVVLPSWREEPN